MPVWAFTRARKSWPLDASRTALVATATTRSAPLRRARVVILTSASNPSRMAASERAPRKPVLPRRTMSRSRPRTR